MRAPVLTIDVDNPLTKVRLHPTGAFVAAASAVTDEIFVWRIDNMQRADLVLRVGSGLPADHLLRDATFHPNGNYLAVSCNSSDIDIYNIGTMGKVRRIATSQATGSQTSTGLASPPLDGSDVLANLSFSWDGSFLLANAPLRDVSIVVDFASHAVTNYFWGSGQGFGLHPEGELVCTTSNDQGGTAIRFVHLSKRLSCRDLEMTVYPNASTGIFSPSGDMLVLICSTSPYYQVSDIFLRVFSFPTCRLLFSRAFRYPRTTVPAWLLKAKYYAMPIERAAFTPNGYIVCPDPDNSIVLLDPTDGSEFDRWVGHTSHATSIDVAREVNVLASSDSAGQILLWDGMDNGGRQPSTKKPITAEFLTNTREIDPFSDWSSFRSVEGDDDNDDNDDDDDDDDF